MLKIQKKQLFKIPTSFAPSKEFLCRLKNTTQVIGRQKIYFDKGSGTYVLSLRKQSKYFEVVEPSGSQWLFPGADLQALSDKLVKKVDADYVPGLKALALTMSDADLIEILSEHKFCLAHYLNEDLTLQDLDTLLKRNKFITTHPTSLANSRAMAMAWANAKANVQYLPFSLRKRFRILENPAYAENVNEYFTNEIDR